MFFRQRQLGKAVETGAHGADADKTAPKVAEGFIGLERDVQLALPRDEHNNRKDGEEGAEKHQLSRRDAVRRLQQAGHADEDADRSDLEANSEHDIGAAHLIREGRSTVFLVNDSCHDWYSLRERTERNRIDISV